MKILKTFGSLKIALSLIVGLAVILAVSTLMESRHGTPFVQKNFYSAIWFDVFLGLIWINIFCSTLSRWPFKKKHIGFVITHAGILTLLIGAFLSRIIGIEGQMTLFEGEVKDRMLLQGYALSVKPAHGKPVTVNLKSRTNNASGSALYPVPLETGDPKFFIGKIYETAVEKMFVAEGTEKDPVNRAIQVSITSETVGVHETFWLIEKDLKNPHSSFSHLGPATFRLNTKSEELLNEPALKITRAGATYLTPPRGTASISVSAPSDLYVSNLRYFPNAKIKDGRIVNAPEETPFNPAVEFEISDAQGRTEHHTRFFLFPDFPSIKGGPSQNRLNLNVQLDVPLPKEMQEETGPGIDFNVSKKGDWTFLSKSSKGTSAETALEFGKKIPAGWMDMQFEVQKNFNRALVHRPVEASKKSNAQFAVQIVSDDTEQWVFQDQPAVFKHKGESFVFSLNPVDHKLPFALHLADFRKIDYPGTTSAASFESDVILMDTLDKITIERTIKMNKPLDHKSFRIFQASYMQDAELGEGSVFSIAKNPGIGLIYAGSIMILIGVITLFYLHPFFTGKKS